MKKILAIIWLAILIGLFLPVSHHARTYSLKRTTLFEKPSLADIDPRLVSILTLGHRGLYEDFLAIHSLQYLVSSEISKVDPNLARANLMLAARQQPRLESFYMLGCFTLTDELKRPDWCEELNLLGSKAIPESWRIPLTQGFIFTSNLQDDAAAAKWYALAASRPGAPIYVGSLATKLADRSQITIEELQRSLELIIDIPGGSKLRETLEKSRNRDRGEIKK